MADLYPSLLRPTDIELFVFEDRSVEIQKTVLSLKKWSGLPIANTFGGKALIDFDGVPMFAELAIMKLFIVSGWQARWIETYGAKANMPYHFSTWIDGKLSQQPIDLIKNDDLLKMLNSIAALNGNKFSGCWDVVGWHNDKVIFAELKRHKKDNLKVTQYNWLSAGLNYGLKSENFLVVEWDFIE